MIIFISGVSRIGKTVLAQHVLERHHISYMSIDHLKMGIYRSDPRCGFTPEDSTEHIGGKLWPMVREIAKTCVENQQSLTIEGCYVLPHDVKQFDVDYLPHIVPVFLAYTEDYIRRNFTQTIQRWQNAIEDRGEAVEENMEAYIRENEQACIRCVEAGQPYFEISGDYMTDMQPVHAYIAACVQRASRGASQEGS